MARTKKLKHLLCRPPKNATEVERWTGKEWKPDDGKPGLAFSYLIGMTPYAAATRCDDDGCSDGSCIKEAAMMHTVDCWGCANGDTLPPLRLQVAR